MRSGTIPILLLLLLLHNIQLRAPSHVQCRGVWAPALLSRRIPSAYRGVRHRALPRTSRISLEARHTSAPNLRASAVAWPRSRRPNSTSSSDAYQCSSAGKRIDPILDRSISSILRVYVFIIIIIYIYRGVDYILLLGMFEVLHILKQFLHIVIQILVI